MKHFLFPFMMLSITMNQIHGQNLVPNPSFEDYVICPTALGQIYLALGWNSYGVTPDYYNACADSIFGVPQNAIGYEPAYSGVAYAGIVSLYSIPEVREFIGAMLGQSLQLGVKYFVSFEVSLADSPLFDCPSNKIGVKFSSIPYSETNSPSIDNVAKIFSQNVISDKSGWTRVSGSFLADSAYQYICIGNFFQFNQIDTTNCGSYFHESYQYIDQVCVSTDSMICAISTDATQNTDNDNLMIYPNPFSYSIMIQSSALIFEWEILNIVGIKVKKGTSISASEVISTHSLPQGSYLLLIKQQNKIITKKIIKIN